MRSLRLLQGYNLTYFANSPYHPPDPSHVAAVTAEAQRAVISSKEMSQFYNSLTWHRPYTDSDIWKLATANISRGVS